MTSNDDDSDFLSPQSEAYFDFSRDEDSKKLDKWSPYVEFRIKLSGLFTTHIVSRTWSTSLGEKTSVYSVKRRKSDQAMFKEFVKLHIDKNSILKKEEQRSKKLKNIPDVFIVRVGVLDGSAGHRTPGFLTDDGSVTSGYFQTYDELFYILYHISNGWFDPLRIVRTSEMRSWVESTIIAEVKRIISGEHFTGKVQFTRTLKKISRELKEFVQNYIRGGEKPKLDNSTILSYRPSKKAADFTLYPEGDDEALVETGQLLEAIDSSFDIEQSSEMSEYVKKYNASILDRKKRIRKQLTDVEKAERSIKVSKGRIEKQEKKIHERLRSSAQKLKSGIIDIEEFDKERQELEDKQARLNAIAFHTEWIADQAILLEMRRFVADLRKNNPSMSNDELRRLPIYKIANERYLPVFTKTKSRDYQLKLESAQAILGKFGRPIK